MVRVRLIIVFLICSIVAMGQTSLRSYEKGGFWKCENNGNDERGDNNATISNATFTSSGKVGGCYSYNGVNTTYLDAGDIGNLGTSYSVFAWINTNDISGSELVVGYRTDNRTTATNLAIQLDINNSDARFLVRDNSGNLGNATASSAITANTWYHLVGVRDGNNLTLYIDGESAATASQTFGIGFMNRLIFGNFWNDASNIIGTSPFDGEIDEIKILNRAVSETEVKMDYNGGDGLLYVQENFKNNGDFNKLINYAIDRMYLSWIL